MSNDTVISISKARRILGPKAKLYSDTQIREILLALQLLAREQLVHIGSNNHDK